MTTDWLLRVRDGVNFVNSSKYRIWGIQKLTSNGKHFVKHVKPGDRLWFVLSLPSQGKLIAVATYRSHNQRNLGPLVNISKTDEELGWTGMELRKIDTEVHYTDLYGLNDCELLSKITYRATISKYNEKCIVNLPVEYSYIARYSKVTVGSVGL